MTRQVIPAPIAPPMPVPLSAGIAYGELLFISGQLPLDPETGSLTDGIEAQTEACLNNLEAVLTVGGGSLASVLKTTVFLRDMNDFAAMNAVYAKAFPSNPPARSAIQVARLPMDALVEIEAVAAREQ